jgi:predicted ATPase/DNA-binding XRE family transcriptional regulator
MAECDSFALLLRRYRQAAGLTQEALAERAHLSARTVSDLERGLNQRPRKDTLLLLAQALALSEAERAQFEDEARQSMPLPAEIRVGETPHDGTTRAQQTNLPRALSSFIGREREQTAVVRLLQEAPLVTLTGIGGCGKTRLALQVAASLLPSYPDGVWLVELAPLADAVLIPQAVAAMLRVREEAGSPLLAALIAHLRPRHLLLLLDNCEHLVLACAEIVTALLQACPQVQILATSREALGIVGERAWKVPSLSLPDTQQPITATQVLEAEALQLFVERAQVARPTFALTEQNAATLVQICRRLDGIPLALELAAARLAALTLADLAARLDDRFRLLTGGSRAALPRQQTLRATLDWSHALLSRPERAVLRRLTVFAGGCTLDAAEAVCSGEGIAPAGVTDLLVGLVNKSLLALEEAENPAVGEGRYRLSETVRQYAAERLADSEEATAVRERHLAWYLAWVLQVAPALAGREQVACLARLEVELDNLRAALGWARETEQTAAGLRLAGSLGLFWDKHSHWSEGRRWLEEFLAQPSEDSPEETALRANALNQIARLAWLQVDVGVAAAAAEQSVALYRTLANPAGLAAALCAWGAAASDTAGIARAVALLEESLALRRELGDKLGLADTLQILAAIERYRNPERAMAMAQECLVVYQDLSHLWDIAGTLSVIGLIAWEQGELEQVESVGTQSLALFRNLGMKRGISASLDLLALVAWEQGDLTQAMALSGESLAVARSLGVGGLSAVPLWVNGVVCATQGDVEQARAVLAECLTLCWTIGAHLGVAYCLPWLAQIAAGTGQEQRAARLAGATEALFTHHGILLPRRLRATHDRTIAAIRPALGDAAFTLAWEEGKALPLEAVVALALE